MLVLEAVVVQSLFFQELQIQDYLLDVKVHLVVLQSEHQIPTTEKLVQYFYKLETQLQIHRLD